MFKGRGAGAALMDDDADTAGVATVSPSYQCSERLMRRRSSPLAEIGPPQQPIQEHELVPLDFTIIDRASLPEGTTQVIVIIASLMAKRVCNSKMVGGINEGLFIRKDGRIVGIAQSVAGERLFVEERWSAVTKPQTPTDKSLS